jgi:hypothetical protein
LLQRTTKTTAGAAAAAEKAFKSSDGLRCANTADAFYGIIHPDRMQNSSDKMTQ